MAGTPLRASCCVAISLPIILQPLLALSSSPEHSGAAVCEGEDEGGQCAARGVREWPRTQQTLSRFVVAGVNLASWSGGEAVEVADPGSEPYELYEDFSIEHLIKGDETWWDLIAYRRELRRPSLSFYTDKVARKRWLPARGLAQPRPFLLRYAHELTASGEEEDEVLEILRLLPARTSYAAKPSHLSTSHGVWLVKHDAESGDVRFSNTVTELTNSTAFDSEILARGLVKRLHSKAAREGERKESWSLWNVKPGLVMEELFGDVEDENLPPMEYSFFVLWGRVWVVQLNIVEGINRWILGFVHRNGTTVKANSVMDHVPEWVDWTHMIDVVERLGAHKDLLRVDMFIGLPSGHPMARNGSTLEERRAAAHYVVSECACHPTTPFDDKEVSDEGARLWMAGYKVGNYRVVPNTEVPQAFLETGSCAPSECDE